MRFVVLGIVLLLLPSQALAEPVVEVIDDRVAVELADDEVVVRGVTPGGAVALLGVGRRWQGAVTVRSLDAEQVADHDGDGVVRYLPGMPLGDRAVFVAVDIATGALGVAARGPAEASPRPLEAVALTGPAGGVDRLRLPGGFAYALIVRPGDGAWWTGLADGNPSDQDGAGDGFFTLAPGRAETLEGGRPAPLAFDGGDLVVTIRPKAMTWSVVSLATAAIVEEEVTR